jgi:hypothetical protein
MRTRITATLGAITLALAGVGAGTASAFPKLHECQHPMVTGEEAYNLHNITVATACKAVRKLGKYLSKPANIRKLYGCHRPKPNAAGTPFLKMHTFDGYDLKIAKSGAFVMYKGSASFSVTGTDFPLNCT